MFDSVQIPALCSSIAVACSVTIATPRADIQKLSKEFYNQMGFSILHRKIRFESESVAELKQRKSGNFFKSFSFGKMDNKTVPSVLKMLNCTF